jgi:hypothetical protein
MQHHHRPKGRCSIFCLHSLCDVLLWQGMLEDLRTATRTRRSSNMPCRSSTSQGVSRQELLHLPASQQKNTKNTFFGGWSCLPCLLQVSLCVCLSLTQLIQCREYRFAVKVPTCNNLPSITRASLPPPPNCQEDMLHCPNRTGSTSTGCIATGYPNPTTINGAASNTNCQH